MGDIVKKLRIDYDAETDTLSLWNSQPARWGQDVSENLTANIDAEGEVVGVTLEHASDLLEPFLTAPILKRALGRLLEPSKA